MTPPPGHPTIPAPKIGLLLVNLGTPNAPEPGAVRLYLREFLSDPRVVEIPQLVWQPILRGLILTTRPKKSAHAYRQIWTEEGSPLAAITARQAKALEGAFGPDVIVDHAMRYGKPAIAERIDALKAAGCERILIAPLYPQYCAATTATALDEAFRHLRHLRWLPAVRTLPPYHDDPAYIGALRESARRASPLWISSRRPSSPASTACRSARWSSAIPIIAIAARPRGCCPTRSAASCWSPSSPASAAPNGWSPPPTPLLAELPGQGVTDVAILAPGFAADCLETLEELAIRGRETFLAAGGRHFAYLPCLNDGAPGMAMLRTIVGRELEGWRPAQ
jgi:ferrochelatase